MVALHIEHAVPLASYTSLQLGGPAEHFARIEDRAQLMAALTLARARDLPLTLLGGGSNVVVSDAGVRGLVLVMATRGVELLPADPARPAEQLVEAQAGESWDALVERCVAQDLAGLECLSGIPGTVGAAPLQNIGAYGQELSDTLRAVEVLDLESLTTRWLERDACELGYRDSRWKHQPGRELVLAVRLALQRGGAATLRYAELQAAVPTAAPSLSQVRSAVLGLRRGKSMLLDPADPNRRSVGSFFMNPVVSPQLAERVLQVALDAGMIADAAALPRYPQPDGRLKLSAAWLIERAGIQKGERHGAVGVSSRHTLALVHHGGGSSAELLQLAASVQERVHTTFGIELAREPVLLGFDVFG